MYFQHVGKVIVNLKYAILILLLPVSIFDYQVFHIFFFYIDI